MGGRRRKVGLLASGGKDGRIAVYHIFGDQKDSVDGGSFKFKLLTANARARRQIKAVQGKGPNKGPLAKGRGLTRRARQGPMAKFRIPNVFKVRTF